MKLGIEELRVLIRGAGDLATGVIAKLHESGFKVVAVEIAQPTVIRRTVSFAQAVFDGETTVEGIRAVRTEWPDVESVWAMDAVPVVVDPRLEGLNRMRFDVVVDAIIAKRNLGTTIDMAPIVIGLGPGFEAGKDVHAVIETMRGHYLGRVLYKGLPEPDTAVPGLIGGFAGERVIRAPKDGVYKPLAQIGERIEEGQAVAEVDGEPAIATISGVLRGQLSEGLRVTRGFKVADVDPRAEEDHCLTISDKARSIGGGVLEAVLHLARAI
ncbi:MAG: EF2563 family selenium-dependent molybdenum hydroxylase system protein [Acidaminobacter sp.]|uniref:selenium-dependent molybdenum cofactor biosynthesis protein YqeB n=1 Tax=Acidaminobacter sp. TaxID=1872102 RepID=UPI0013808BB1|nr:selenium-dependent molybdenum cofactor biosynthesis protein YqeB [Acidaminobacter sp.]MZQ99334.1 EF2563 family selenium-dependent molybdenum hydroxylase system protein [Acidaminobacter sp.]